MNIIHHPQSRLSKSRLSRRSLPVERLEARLALTTTPIVAPFLGFQPNALGPNLSWVGSTPASGQSVVGPVNTVTVSFDRPIDPGSLFIGDVIVNQEVNGNWQLANDPSTYPTETVSPDGNSLVLTFDHPLGPGDYQIVMPAGNSVFALDGSQTADTGSLDDVIGDFTVRTAPLPGPTGNAGLLSQSIWSTTDTLDLSNNPVATGVYQFSVPTGHFWRLGADVSGAFASTLTLYNSNSVAIATSSTGRPGQVNDTYLFQGIGPGTYSIAVSGQNFSNPQAGGSFTLQLVADPADSPTRLTSFQVDHSDPLDPAPTGLTFSFNGLLNVSGLQGDPSPGIILVNQNGQQFPMTAVGLNEVAGQYTFLFDHKLPAGKYTVEVPSDGGVTDLAGLTPIAPGRPAGVLGRFNVSAGQHAWSIPGNLGPLYIGDVTSGITNSVQIPAGTAFTYRFVVDHPALFTFQTQSTGGSLGVGLIGVGASHFGRFGSAVAGGSSTAIGFLNHGVYYVEFFNTGNTNLSLTWSLRQDTQNDSLLSNGIGQSPALTLRFIDPLVAAGLGSGSSSSASFGPAGLPPSSGAPGTGGFGPGSGSNSTGDGSAGGGVGNGGGLGVTPPSLSSSPSFNSIAPGGLLFTIAGLPVGKPSTQSEQVGAVGPSLVSLASSSAGLMQGINYGTLRVGSVDHIGEGLQDPTVEPPTLAGEPNSTRAAAPAPGSILSPLNGAMTVSNAGEDTRADELAIIASEWLGRVGTFAADWMKLASDTTPLAPVAPGANTAAPPTETLASDPGDRSGRTGGRVEQASFGAPLVFGIGSLLAVRCSPTVRNWLNRHRRIDLSRQDSGPKGIIRGPHRRF